MIIQDHNAIKSIIWEPTEPSHRVEAQKSVFVRPPTGFIQPDKAICIPKALKVPILKYLIQQDPPIKTETIYNDLHGFIKIQNRYRNACVKFCLGFDYEEQGDAAEAVREKHEAYEKAIDHYKDAIDLMPNFVIAHIGCGLVHARLGDLNSAFHYFNEVLDWQPDEFNAHYYIGNVYLSKRDYDRAIENYTKAIDLNPDFAEAYCSRGVAYISKSEIDRAVDDFSKAIQFKSDLVEAYYNRGNAYSIKGDYSCAAEDLTKVIQLNPNHVEAYYYRATVWLHLGEWETAKSDLITARDMGINIIASFHNDYESVTDFEGKNGVKLPADIAAMLTPQQ